MTDSTAIITAVDRNFEPVGVRELAAHLFRVEYEGSLLAQRRYLYQAQEVARAVNRALARDRELRETFDIKSEVT